MIDQSAETPMVSVHVLTYNQELFIRQTLDSIINQVTDYYFEVIIGEDCSTDNTHCICQEYVDKYSNVRFVPQDHNLGVVGNYINCINHSNGKYLMGCAGDDYWHNPNKIQLQVDFMEAHPDCVVCHTDIDELSNKTGKIKHNVRQSKGIVPKDGRIQKEILNGKECIAAVTQCIRKDAFNKYIPKEKFVELGFPREDWPTQLVLSAHGDICYLSVSTATYRVGQESITNAHDYDKIRRRYQADKKMTEYMYSMFPDFGSFEDGWWFDTYVYHSLLAAAYDNDDYKSAKEFASKDPKKGLMSKMAKCWLTFQIFRIYRNKKK